MKNKLVIFISSAAVLSLMVSTAALIESSRMFSKGGSPLSVPADSIRIDGEMSADKPGDDPLSPYFPSDGSSAAPDGTEKPSESAGLSEDALYLMVYDNGMLLAFDESGGEIFSSALKAERLTENELKLLSEGIMIAGSSALREALEDLLY